jgi:hypothetical protein
LRRNASPPETAEQPAIEEKRHCERSEAIHLATEERMDCFAALAKDAEGSSAPPTLVITREGG